MYYFYKKYRIVYYVLAIAIFLLFLAVLPSSCVNGDCYNVYGARLGYGGGMLLSGTAVLLYVPCVLIAVFASARITNSFAMRHFDKTLRLLYTELDPKAFLDRFEPDMEKFRGCRLRGRITPYIFYIQALKENGDIDKALSVLNEISAYRQFSSPKFSPLVSVAYSELWSAYHALVDFDGEMVFARKLLEAADTSAAKNRTSKYKPREELVAFINGDTEKALSLHLDIAQSPKSVALSRLRALCRIAEIYALQGDSENAREHLSLAKEISGSIFTYISAEALVERILQGEK